MASLTHIDMTNVTELGEGFRAIPPGEYQVYIEESGFEPTTDNRNGKNKNEYLKFMLVVCTGEYENSKIPVFLNLINESADSVIIAKSQLAAICEATYGQPFVNDSSLLHNRPFFALIDNVPAYDKATKSDHPTNRANKVIFKRGTIRSIGSGGVSPVPAQAQVAAKQQEVKTAAVAPVVAGNGLPPWKQKK